jgi:hypothetical protein
MLPWCSYNFNIFYA